MSGLSGMSGTMSATPTQTSDDVARSSTASPESDPNRRSERSDQEAQRPSTGTPQSDLQRGRSDSDLGEAPVEVVVQQSPEGMEKHGAGVGSLDETEQAKVARDRELLARSSTKSDIPEDQQIIPARNKDVSITTSTTAATVSPPCSETWSLDRGYPEAPALLIINTSDNAELMHDNFSASPSEMARRVGL